MTIMVVILMLFTNRARSNSLAFLAGWAAGMAILVIVMLVISDNTHVSGSAHKPSTATSAIKGVARLDVSLSGLEELVEPSHGGR